MNKSGLKIIVFFLFSTLHNIIFVKASVNTDEKTLFQPKSKVKNLFKSMIETTPGLFPIVELIFNEIKEKKLSDKWQAFSSHLNEKLKQYPILIDRLIKNQDKVFQGDKNALYEILNDIHQYLNTEPDVKEILKVLYCEMKKNNEKNKKCVIYIHVAINMGNKIMILDEEIVSYNEFMHKIRKTENIGNLILCIIFKNKKIHNGIESIQEEVLEVLFYTMKWITLIFNDKNSVLEGKQISLILSQILDVYFNLSKSIYIEISSVIKIQPKINKFLKNYIYTCQEAIIQIYDFKLQTQNDPNKILNMKMLASFLKIFLVYFDILNITFSFVNIEKLKNEHDIDEQTLEKISYIKENFKSIANTNILLMFKDIWAVTRDFLESLYKIIDIDTQTEERFINEALIFLKKLFEENGLLRAFILKCFSFINQLIY